jgi:DNA anti-recombination protein RmuC
MVIMTLPDYQTRRILMQPELGYVETIQAEQVLTAMQSMGWQPGTKCPGYAAIQTTLRRLFGNGGDGNRMRELREAAIRLASGLPAEVDEQEQEQTDRSQLPDEVKQELQAMAASFEQQLTRLDRRLAERLDRVQSEINADARTQIDAIRRDVEDRLTAAN